MRIIAIIKKILKKLKKMYHDFYDPWWRAKKRYIKYFEELTIDDHSILIESQHGKEMNGNVFYILKYMSESEKYTDFKIYLCARAGKVKAFQNVLNFYNLENIKITVLSSDEYFQILASAKYLINDNTFLPFFMKKEGQVYLNTWHGTPLKSLGRGIKNDAHAIGNAQKNFASADYLLFPNDHTRDAILKDYMIENIAEGFYIMAGYPRNEAFFNTERKKVIIGALELNGKKVYAYMPTFRGTAGNGGTSKSSHYMNYYLYELDKQLQDDEILYVNLHPISKKDVQFSDFTHIRNFPANYETYDFLNAADVLVTDYSSVFFDFACSGKKIVLFPFDKEDYLKDRGMYMSMDELPFPQVSEHEDLLAELRSPKTYDDTDFLSRFCKYESADASKKLCNHVILGENTGLEMQKVPNNGKENVLLYAGNLSGNGITASLRNLLNCIDLNKRNYYFSFYSERAKKHAQTIFTFPERSCYFGMTGDANLTVMDLVIRKAYRLKLISAPIYMRLEGKRVKQDLTRVLGNARFDHVIQFNGYEDDVILSFSTFDGKKTIFVHSDMVHEIEKKGNQRRDVLHYAYNHYDNVAIVSEDIEVPTVELSGKQGNIHVSKNLINYRAILDKSNADIQLDTYTKATTTKENLKLILNGPSECFINVGRFAPEKGQERLISAFYTYHQKLPDSYLIVMGGYSLLNGYAKLCNHASKLGLQDRVILLENVSNPYPIIKACDYFVFSSFYESFGLVLAEADILGLPVVSTDIPGPRGFMNKYGGTLVENSEEGIYHGMEMLHAGKVKPMTVDYEAYNQEAIQEFEQLLSNSANCTELSQ